MLKPNQNTLFRGLYAVFCAVKLNKTKYYKRFRRYNLIL